MPTWVGSTFAETGGAGTTARVTGSRGGPAAYRKTGQLTLRYIGGPDTVGVLLPGRPPATSAQGRHPPGYPAPLNQPI